MPNLFGRTISVKRLFASSLLVVASVFMLSACASKGVTAENRAVSKKYDGNWNGVIGRTPAKFRAQNWRVNCWNMQDTIVLNIKDGKVNLFWRGKNIPTYISEKGAFKVVIKQQDKVKNKTQNKGSLLFGTSFIFTGSLSQEGGSGRLMHAYKDFGDQGCSSKIKFSKGTA